MKLLEMRGLAIPVLLSLSLNTPAQSPGGVTGYLYWSRPCPSIWPANDRLCHVPVSRVSAPFKRPPVTMGRGLVNGFTIFAVHADSVNRGANLSLQGYPRANAGINHYPLETTGRGRIIDIDRPHRAAPRIITFTREGVDNDSLQWHFNFYVGLAGNKKIPVCEPDGLLMEVIVYDRVLTYSERARVESYLALKHGISLRQEFPSSYLNSLGKVIWDGHRFRSYSASMAGLGRDNNSGLYLSRSGSMEEPGLLEIEVDHVYNGEFLVWGHNNRALEFCGGRGKPRKLKRHWSIAATGDFSNRVSTLHLSAPLVNRADSLAGNEIYWLAVDHEGDGNFPAYHTRYYPAKPGNNNRHVFEGVKWDIDGSGHDLFTFLAAPPFFVAFDKELPSCTHKTGGSIAVSVNGGSPPYLVYLYGNGLPVARVVLEGNFHEFGNLSRGRYRLTAVDAGGLSFTGEFLLPNHDHGHFDLFRPLVKDVGTSLRLNASGLFPASANYSFYWESPSGNISRGPELLACEAGIYLLSVTTSDGCVIQRELEVHDKPAGIFSSVEVFPNPTSHGRVHSRIRLREIGEVHVAISNPKGQVLGTALLSGNNFYSFSSYLPYPGTWFLTLDATGERQTIRITRE